MFGEIKVSSDRGTTICRSAGAMCLPGYTVLNLGLTYQLHKQVSLLARLNNATDARYMLANTYSTPGATFVALNWSM